MPPIRLAMWSGPRNISTAMMRSWGSRSDTVVTDEPLYACYLRARPEVDHPGREEVIASMETDWRKVVATLQGPSPGAKNVWFQKHMSHHLLPEMDKGWVAGLCNCFLIRDPREVLVSLAKVMPHPRLRDTGLPQQLELFEAESQRTARRPPVIDAHDVLLDPRGTLSALCAAVGIPFQESMLRWEPGPRATDGVWARHWYAAAEKSTGFEPYRPRDEALPGELETLWRDAEQIYRTLREHRIFAPSGLSWLDIVNPPPPR